jgi:cysteine synthase
MMAAGLELVVASVAFGTGGQMAGIAAMIGASLATAAQIVAVLLLRPAMGAPLGQFQQRWVLGMAVRFASFLALAAVMVVTRSTFPLLWMASGYLATLLVLLFAETRFLT